MVGTNNSLPGDLRTKEGENAAKPDPSVGAKPYRSTHNFPVAGHLTLEYRSFFCRRRCPRGGERRSARSVHVLGISSHGTPKHANARKMSTTDMTASPPADASLSASGGRFGPGLRSHSVRDLRGVYSMSAHMSSASSFKPE